MSHSSVDVNFEDVADDLLSELRKHVNRLHDRVNATDELVHRSHAVNEKVNIMKEYKDEANKFNSCFRAKDRSGLVRSLQHENRQILNLQEENRQLKLALEDVQRGMTLIMEKHRAVVRDMSRSAYLMNIVKKHYEQPTSEKTFETRFYELADILAETIRQMETQHNNDVEVCAENLYLRTALVGRGALVPGINADQHGKPLDLSYLAKVSAYQAKPREPPKATFDNQDRPLSPEPTN